MAAFICWLSLISIFSILSITTATDTITANSSISGPTQKLISSQGNFALGFFQPSNSSSSSSSSWYIAIWYNNIPLQTSVFVANRNTPVPNPNNARLTILSNGNLALLNGSSETLIWSTDVTGINPANETEAVLDDGGNLKLRYVANRSSVLWQSIDHPTNTWLPGGKLGFNKTSGISQRLISWKSNADPSEGVYSILLDPNGTNQYFLQWNETTEYYKTGSWSPSQRIFANVPEMTENYIYNFSFVDNDEESYFTYSIKPGTNLISRFVMDVNGQIKQQNWIASSGQWILFWSQPKQACDVYVLCGPYGSCNAIEYPYCNCLHGFSLKSKSNADLEDYTAGCVRNTELQCEGNNSSSSNNTNRTKLQRDGFYVLTGMRYPDNARNLSGINSQEECESVCLSNCSCSAYSYETGCDLWYGGLLNLEDGTSGSNTGTLYLRLAASEFASGKSNKGLIVGLSAGGAVAGLLCVAIGFVIVKRKRDLRAARLVKDNKGTLIAFRYDDLQFVTRNFSEKLGGGAFGSVYKGELPDSTALAVKKLDGFYQGEKQFRAEVSTIGTIQHVNLVRLIGFCSESSYRLLVYEYMPKGSLDAQLFNRRDVTLNWGDRYKIAVGTARGLAYLHEQCRDCIIHCDIKPENILLDDDLVPKVADFGLSKLLGRDFSRVLTTMRGTRGYLAPEWITGVPITPKADVFSYGMMLFEIISGHRNNADQWNDRSARAGFFPAFAARKLTEGDVQTLIDENLNEDVPVGEVERACKVACWCIQDDETARPTMGQVVQILEGVLEVNTPPMPVSLSIMGESDQSPDYINYFTDVSNSGTGSNTRSTTEYSSTSVASSLVKNSG